MTTISITPICYYNGRQKEERTVDKIDGRYERYLVNLPVIPEVATKILSVTDKDWNISFEELENIIKIDPGLTTKILKIANSALYARQREITDVQQAIVLLGLKSIRSLVLLVAASNALRGRNGKEFYRQYWRHSVYSAFLARHLCLRTGMVDSVEIAFLGGVLHDMGQVALFNTDPDSYLRVLAKSSDEFEDLVEQERTAFGIDHRELGALAFTKWNFPDVYVDIAREHGGLNIVSPHKQIIMIISVATILANLRGTELSDNDETRLSSFVSRLRLSESDVAYYHSQFRIDVQKEPLFRQCKEIFNIN